MKIEDIKVGDRVRLLPWVGGSDFSNAAVGREVSVEGVESPYGAKAGLVFVRWLEFIGWHWPVAPLRSTPAQRLARVEARVGRLVALASGPDRLAQLQRRMLRAQQAEWEMRRDGCEICHGAKGGVLGNENIIGGKKVCDYCHAAMGAAS